MKHVTHFTQKVYLFIGSILLGCFPYICHALAKSDTGLPDTLISSGLQDVSVATFVASAIGAILGIIGVVFLVLIIYGGFLWMIGGDDEKKITKARELIYYAILGLIIIVSAGAITKFILIDTLLKL